MNQTLTVEAVYDNGVLRPTQPLPLAPQQRVTLKVQIPGAEGDWPVDVANIYKEIAAEDLRLAEAMLPAVRETWPACEDKP
jgi:predicted DNA-binding antitoxin AbrB/MazE fold protein